MSASETAHVSNLELAKIKCRTTDLFKEQFLHQSSRVGVLRSEATSGLADLVISPETEGICREN